MISDLPEDDIPNSLDMSTVMVRIEPFNEMSTFFIQTPLRRVMGKSIAQFLCGRQFSSQNQNSILIRVFKELVLLYSKAWRHKSNL
jgi:hypothetical protein